MGGVEYEIGMLELKSITKLERGSVHVEGVSLSLARGALHVLLGPTGSGKTTLMRLMAGLDKPTSGAILMDGVEITGQPVRKRDVAMVYQQFVNYPSLSVYENIASPLRVRGMEREKIDQKVREAAGVMNINALLQRRPSELSGGQQQRVALARAVVKDASLILLDEPLANLDYKLREELRTELPKMFKRSGGVVVYATSAPEEALLIGESVACLHEGRLTAAGAPRELYDRPQKLSVAKIMSDPPLNTLRIKKDGSFIDLGKGVRLKAGAHMISLADGSYDIGLRAHHIGVGSDETNLLDAEVSVAEVVGSETIVHVNFMDAQWVVLLNGVHAINASDKLALTVDTDQLFVFSESGEMLAAPARLS